MCGVAVKTVRRWRRLYQRRGVVRGALGSACPRCDGRALDGHAYSHLLGVYLGDGHIIQNKRGVFLLSLYQDKRYVGLISEWRESLETARALLAHTCRTSLAASRSRATGCIGRASSRSMAPDASTSASSCWSHGSGRSSRRIRGRSFVVSSTRMAADSPTGPSAHLLPDPNATSTRGTSSATSRWTSSGCAHGRSTFLTSPGDNPDVTTSRWRGGRPSQPWTTSSARSTDGPPGRVCCTSATRSPRKLALPLHRH